MDKKWCESRVAQRLINIETDKLSRCMPDLTGHYLLQYSAFNEIVVQGSSLKHSFVAVNESCDPSEDQLQMYYQQLPFRDNSLDCIVTHHVLDFSSNPHQCLREAARVVVPNGYMVIVGFNPWSAWGLSRLLPRTLLSSKGRQLSRGRVVDWLTLLGFRVEEVKPILYVPPVILRYFPNLALRIESLLHDMNCPFGGVYIIIARKLVAGRTPVRPQWRPLARHRIPVATPSTRGARVTDR
jgi:SAM-dependent methyltransferase